MKNTWPRILEQLLTYFCVILMLFFFFFPGYFDTDVDSSLRMRSNEDPIWISTTGNYSTNSTSGPKSMSFNYVKWNLGATSESVHFHTLCVTFNHKGSMNITGFVRWSSRMRKRFWFNAWYLKGEKNFKKDVITVQVQVMFACLYHMKYKQFPFMYCIFQNKNFFQLTFKCFNLI